MGNSKYVPSAGVAAAAAAAERQKGDRPEYQSAWDRELAAVMEQILNREQFRYDLDGDALYQQYRQQAARDGRRAMTDTMAQAAALTGGYGNSYAQIAGQQAYQRELDTLADRIPELYALAMDQYRAQSEALQKRYDLLSGREKEDYDRYRDSLSAWQQEADRLWGRYTDARDFDYRSYRDTESDAQKQRDYDYRAMRDSVEDYKWLSEYNEDLRRYNQEWDAKNAPKSTGAPAGAAYVPQAASKQEEEKKKPAQSATVTL